MKLFLIDGNSFCYRAFYAIRSLATSYGKPTNAVYGFVTMLNKLVKDEKPDYLGVAFDLKGPTFRHKKYEDYKIHRKPMPDDLISQIPVIKNVVRAYNIPIYEVQGFEADDVLATISKKISRKNIDVYIVTGDKDALQLVDERIRVYNTHKEGLIYDVDKIKEQFGFGPERVLDYLALAGDASDNIPGVTGIGEKTAIELLKEFGSLNDLYENLEKLKSKSKREILEKYRTDAELSMELARLDENVPLEINLEDLRLKEPDKEKLHSIFRELEFKRLLNDVTVRKSLNADYRLITNYEEFDTLINELKKVKEFCFDFETTGVDPMRAEIVGISFSWNEGESFFVGLKPHEDNRALDPKIVLSALKPIFEDESIRKVGQNIKYEFVVLSNYGINLRGISFDTMVGSYLLDPSKLNHNLDDISMEYLQHKMTDIKELIGKGKTAVTMDKVDIEKVSAYCSEDSDVTLRLKNIINSKLKELDLMDLFCEIEMPLVEVLGSMEFKGVTIDLEQFKVLSEEIDKRLNALTKEIKKETDSEFNINSPKQLQEILFVKLKLPPVKKIKTGFSTDEEVLTKLATMHSVPKMILEFRELSKLKSTYVDALPKLINPKTNKVHTSFNQTVTQTGRLSSSEPNLQNIPIKKDIGGLIRKAFIPSSNSRVLVSADYSQIELRVLAHLANDENLIKAFKDDMDIHKFTASLVFGVDEKKVDENKRNMAKIVNFGIIYGMSPYGLSQALGVDVESAGQFIKSYFERYPKVKAYLDSQIQFAKENGYVLTLKGRRRYIPEINSTDIRMRQFAERTAINTPIQGTAADLIKVAMINIHRALLNGAYETEMIMQVHDELIFDVPKLELSSINKLIKEKMENVFRLKVPIKVNISSGNNWLEME